MSRQAVPTFDDITPLFSKHDDETVAQMLGAEYSPDVLAELLVSAAPRVARAALSGLGMCGKPEHARFVLPFLHDHDAETAATAEDALWSIWMRAGSAYANMQLARAVDQIKNDDIDSALNTLGALTALERDFAEAHHQRGIAACLIDDYELAERCFAAALELNRHHFGAIAGLGHMATQRADLASALRHYRNALRINPRLDGISEAVAMIESALNPPAARSSA